MQIFRSDSLSPEKRKEIISLADENLGQNYLSEYDLEQFSNFNPQYYCFIKDDRLRAFALFLSGQRSVMETAFGIQEPGLRENDYEGVLKTVVTHRSFKGKGIATALIAEGLLQFQKMGIKNCFSFAWLENKKINLEGPLIKNGFLTQKVVDGYWTEQSAIKKITCPVCGPPPCYCKAYLFKWKNPGYSGE